MKKKSKSEGIEILSVSGPLPLPEGYHYVSRNPKAKNSEKILRKFMRAENKPKKHSTKYTCQDLRDIVDDFASPPKGYRCPEPYSLKKDTWIDEVAKKHGRDREGIQHVVNYLTSYYEEFGKRNAMYEKLQGTTSRLDPSRKPSPRDIYLFRKANGWRDRGTTGKRASLKRSEIKELLHLSDDRLDDLYDRYPPIREVKGLWK